MDGTIIYDKDQKQIYPVSHAEVITSNASGNKSNVEYNLEQLWDEVNKLSGVQEEARNIMVVVTYCKTNTRNESEVKQLSSWSDTFELPDPERPYVWKKTLYTYEGDTGKLNEVYEIVASDVSTIIQNIYTRTEGITPVIEYKQKTDEDGKPLEEYDYNYYRNGKPAGKLNSLPPTPEGQTYKWEDYPQDISLSFSSVFMSRRIRQGGEWGPFSTPAQYGQWPTTES